jgi:hypothetical protein
MIHIEKTPEDNVFVFWEPSSNWNTQGTFNGECQRIEDASANCGLETRKQEQRTS